MTSGTSPAATRQDIFSFLKIDKTVRVKVRFLNVTRRYRSKGLRQFLRKPTTISRQLHKLLPPSFFGHLEQWNLYPTPVFPVKLRRELTEGYGEDILALQKFRERDLSYWLVDEQQGNKL